MENTFKPNRPYGGTISCDQVAWLLAVADRYLPPSDYPGISQKREMMKFGMLYEIMEILHLDFADDMARRNATPSTVQPPPIENNDCLV